MRFRLFVLFLATICSFGFSAVAATPDLRSDEKILLVDDVIIMKMLPASDGGFLEVGMDTKTSKYYVCKRDINLKRTWSKDDNGCIVKVFESIENGIGIFSDNGTDTSISVLSEDGILQRSIHLTEDVKAVYPTDSGFLTESLFETDEATIAELVKLSPDGNVEWKHTFDGVRYFGINACVSANGRLFVAGNVRTSENDYSKAVIMCINDASGNIEWEQLHPVSGNSTIRHALLYEDKIFALGTAYMDSTYPGHERPLIICSSVDGLPLWERQFDFVLGHDESSVFSQHSLGLEDNTLVLLGTFYTSENPAHYAYQFSLSLSGEIVRQAYGLIPEKYDQLGSVRTDLGLRYLFGVCTKEENQTTDSSFIMMFQEGTGESPHSIIMY